MSLFSGYGEAEPRDVIAQQSYATRINFTKKPLGRLSSSTWANVFEENISTIKTVIQFIHFMICLMFFVIF